MTWAPTIDLATATPTAPPPTATPIALLERFGVIDAVTSVPTPVADVVIEELGADLRKHGRVLGRLRIRTHAGDDAAAERG